MVYLRLLLAVCVLAIAVQAYGPCHKKLYKCDYKKLCGGRSCRGYPLAKCIVNNCGGCVVGFFYNKRAVKCKPNPCRRRPCGDRGNCKQANNKRGYRCVCKKGYYGINCQHNYCKPNPCKYGSCYLYKYAKGLGFKCRCRPGYYGRRCHKSYCKPNPCKNDGKCSYAKNKRGYSCQCKRGFYGLTCQHNYCKPNPCQNGSCYYFNYGQKLGYKCRCKPGYYGNRCHRSYCKPNPCKNGGNCVYSKRGFKCTCKLGYYGRTCSSAKKEYYGRG